MAEKNSTIIAALNITNTNDFAQRLPEPTQANMSRYVRELFNPANRRLANEFMSEFINRVALEVSRVKRFEDPWSAFDKQRLEFGSTIEEYGLKWLRAHEYRDDDSGALLKVERPEAAVAFHTVNRENRYDISINRVELQRAFLAEYGLNRLAADIMTLPNSSDAYDTFNIKKQLLGFYEQEYGFYKVPVSSAPTTKALADELLIKVRTFADLMQFPSTKFNARVMEDIPVFEKDRSRLILIVRPDVKAAMDVLSLAAAFNRSDADINMRILAIDEWPFPDALALLTTEDLLLIHDTVYQTESFWNGATLTENYYLHHHSVNSISPFVPAVLFTTRPATELPTVTMDVTGLTATDVTTSTVWLGEKVTIPVILEGTLTMSDGSTMPIPEELAVRPSSAVEWTITEVSDGTDTYEANGYNIFIDKDNRLVWNADVIRVDGKILSEQERVTVKAIARSSYVNPSGDTPELLAEVTVTLNKPTEPEPPVDEYVPTDDNLEEVAEDE